jgi:hypothetical protein
MKLDLVEHLRDRMQLDRRVQSRMTDRAQKCLSQMRDRFDSGHFRQNLQTKFLLSRMRFCRKME